MIAFSLVGCAALKEMKTRWDAREHIFAARELFDQSDYEGSLKETQKVLALINNSPPEDEALFNAGVIYAHYGYPKKDYHKSLEFLKRLVRNFPQSPYAAKAKFLIVILQENERSKREIEDLNKAIKKSKQVDIEIDEKKKGLSR